MSEPPPAPDREIQPPRDPADEPEPQPEILPVEPGPEIDPGDEPLIAGG